KQDTMQSLNDKSRIKLCVDCHREQRDNPAFNPSSVHLGKEHP
ncbi:MAG TPA: cytochrome C nitrite reductase, partial [Atlantibacter hermannii]|nr:cytochrome C nitrite reductase [Atlantibacter hermannii]